MLGIDPITSAKLLDPLGDDDDAHKVYIKEEEILIPARRPSQFVIEIEPQAKTRI